MAFTHDTRRDLRLGTADLTLITGVGRAGVTRDQVEAYCARRDHEQPLVHYFLTHRTGSDY